MLKGNIDFDEGSVSGQGQDPSRFDRLARAVEMYDRWCDLAREACVIWALFAKRMGFNKDVRKMIAKMVWEGRRLRREMK